MVDRMQNAVFHCLHLMRDKCKDFFRLSKLFWAKYEKSRPSVQKSSPARPSRGIWKYFLPCCTKNLFDEKKNAYICTRKPRWWNGRHACFRYMCRKVCWFESGSGHRKPSQNTVKAFLYPAFFAAYLNAFTPPLSCNAHKKRRPSFAEKRLFIAKAKGERLNA